MRFPTLDAWLAWQETLHPSTIELGLERPGQVLDTLGLRHPEHAVITVAGTNGKGSSVAMLESILRAAGYRVGCYTSPHLLRYNERVRIDGKPVEDAALCDAFERIDRARGDTSLTYFEFGTLAAMDIFSRAGLDVAVLEVGMGGRLDAVNLQDADVALVTAIDVDHAAWLGDEREAIGREKAGIFRSQRPAVCSDPNPPASLEQYAAELGSELYRLGEQFSYTLAREWSWQGPNMHYPDLPLPALRGGFQLQNAAGVLMALVLLGERLPVSAEQIREGLLSVSLPGRFQRLPGEVTTIIDVAHNPQSAEALAANLRALAVSGHTHAVVGVLADKDLSGVLGPMRDCVDLWYPAALDVPRGADSQTLLQALAEQGIGVERGGYGSVSEALAAARACAQPGDRIVVFGSFYTVAEALAEAV
jgi:dihydrofolate synthase/folylpolyglutamate synthase